MTSAIHSAARNAPPKAVNTSSQLLRKVGSIRMMRLLPAAPACAGDAALGQLAQVRECVFDLVDGDRAILVTVLKGAGAGLLDRHLTDGGVARQRLFHQRRALRIPDDRVERGHYDGILRQPALGLLA